MFEIKDLHVNISEVEKKIINGINLKINPGEVHAIMGPNGSGKSTLSYTLSGKEGYEIEKGDIELDGESILDDEPDERAAKGIFLAFQYPIEIPGVGNLSFIRTALNSQRKFNGKDELNPAEFLKILREKADFLNVDMEMLKRPLNVGFSGGEKKRNEILQMALLEPRFCILDETDSGLDVDAMKQVSKGVNSLRSENRSFLIITHYQRLLNYIKPDFVHIMAKGKIIKTGGPELALEVEDQGYTHLLN
jgi:Fe-S cluster assembly ATP-binding protein|tara:strand:+ start:534 stop:1280 length:747 start_codon:yes stop_codon:yes gene_type:complete